MDNSSTLPSPLSLVAFVGDSERSAWEEAARLLTSCLAASEPSSCPVDFMLESAVRSDLLLPDASTIPDELHRKGVVPKDLTSYSRPLYQSGAKLIVFSLIADIVQPILKHREKNYRFVPLECWRHSWTPEQQAWIAENFAEETPLEVAASAQNWRHILAEVRKTSTSGVYLANVFRKLPGPVGHRYFRQEASLLERIRHYDLLAAEISKDTGAHVIDLDCFLADIGARQVGADYQLGQRAAAHAADIVVGTFFRVGLENLIGEEMQNLASAHYEGQRMLPAWETARTYQQNVETFFARFRGLHPIKDAAGMQRAGAFLQACAARLEVMGWVEDLGLHRRFMSAIRELGEAFVERCTATRRPSQADAGLLKARIDAATAKVAAVEKELEQSYRTCVKKPE